MSSYLSNIHAAGTAANRPAAGVAGRLYFSTDTGLLHRDSGAAWVRVGNGNNWQMAARWQENQTKTNIAAAWQHVYSQAGGEGWYQWADFTGFTEARFLVNMNHVTAVAGECTWAIAKHGVVNLADRVCEVASGTTAGEKQLDSGWVSLPAWATGELKIVLACIGNGADDPIFRAAAFYLR